MAGLHTVHKQFLYKIFHMAVAADDDEVVVMHACVVVGGVT